MAANLDEILREHPCFGPCKLNKGRIHLPVAPSCNMECRFCSRKINDTEQRPGVTSRVIRPEEAPECIREALRRCPEISVVGIAGPGDTLASPEALETFRLIGGEFPQLLKCMSTNGLLLEEKVEEVVDAGVDTLTVTVNAVDPAIEARLNNRILYHGKIYSGVEAASILIRHQLRGISLAARAGILIKVNTVLVPGINGCHIAEIARTVREAGADMYNIIPLIPQNELRDSPSPTAAQLEEARESAEQYIQVFRHCQHCRADAIGIPGVSDIGGEIYRRILLLNLRQSETFSHG